MIRNRGGLRNRQLAVYCDDVLAFGAGLLYEAEVVGVDGPEALVGLVQLDIVATFSMRDWLTSGGTSMKKVKSGAMERLLSARTHSCPNDAPW